MLMVMVQLCDCRVVVVVVVVVVAVEFFVECVRGVDVVGGRGGYCGDSVGVVLLTLLLRVEPITTGNESNTNGFC